MCSSLGSVQWICTKHTTTGFDIAKIGSLIKMTGFTFRGKMINYRLKDKFKIYRSGRKTVSDQYIKTQMVCIF